MDDFLRFIDELAARFPVHVSIQYGKITDWTIMVTKNGCADMYPNCVCIGDDVVICSEQSADIELAFAQAHVAVKRWLLEYNGGY